MNERTQTILYAQVAQDLVQRYGVRAFEVAEEAGASLEGIGDTEGHIIWRNIADAVGQMDRGFASACIH